MPKGIYPRRQTIAEKFWARVNKEGPIHPVCGQCWQWTANLANGYGDFKALNTKSHRASWIIHFGEIPDSLHVLHRCDNRGCVNPDHLFLGTSLDNNQDMRAKGREADCSGESNGNRKLSKTDVKEIRARYKRWSQRKTNMKQLADEFGVTRTMVCYIVRGLNWRNE